MRRKYAVGQRYGKWTIMELPTRSKKVYLKCDCGTEGWYWLSNISSNKSTQCQKCRKYAPEFQTYKSVIGTAKRRKIDWLLTFDEWKEISQQECNYCGADPSNNIVAFGYKYNGIDRVDSKLCYTKENVVACCRVCNRAKSDMSTQEFYEWIDRVYGRLISK